MEEEVRRNLKPKPNPVEQQQALSYLEQLKNSDVGLHFCMAHLIMSPTHDDNLRFFCFQVVEHFVKNRYNNNDQSEKQHLRDFLNCLMNLQYNTPLGRSETTYLRNKAAQIFALVFVHDYPTHWPDFFEDLIKVLHFGPKAADIYMRILKAIDTEVADLDIVHTQQEAERNIAIKDAMRATSVHLLVKSWLFILETYKTYPDLLNLCLEVVGSYVAWIDITLVATDHFIEMVLSMMEDCNTREAAAVCINDIISKGMNPMYKLQLIDTLVDVLQAKGYITPLQDDETDYTNKMSKLMNGIGTNLIAAHNKLAKTSSGDKCMMFQQSIDKKIPILIEYLCNDYDEVCAGVLEFAKEYIHLLKNNAELSDEQMDYTNSILKVIVHKMKYDDSYNFEQEGEDEGAFQEFRKQLKVIFDNLAGLNKEMLITYVSEFFNTKLSTWQTTSFLDVELAIHLLYLVGEALPTSGGNHFTGEDTKVAVMRTMMHLLVTCGVSEHEHASVTLQYVETIARYDKFFHTEPEHIPNIIIGFLDHRGMRNNSPLVRSRSAYLFSRLVKGLRSLLPPYAKMILEPLQYFLVLVPPDGGQILITQDDQLYLYEAAGVLILTGAFNSQEKGMLISSMVLPVLESFKSMMAQLVVETDRQKQELLAQSLCHAMAVTSRGSKAFNNHQTMNTLSCVLIYTEATKVFLECLQIPIQTSVLQAGVRQFLHRMVVCLEEELLPYIPQASEGLLKGNDIRSIQEYIPLIVQVIGKFKKEVIPFLQQMLMPIVNTIFSALLVPVEDNDMQGKQDRQLLQRNYFQFIAALVSNNVIEVLSAQQTDFLEQVMMSIIQGAVEFPDPVAQRTCFSILRKLVNLWGGENQPPGFTQFIYKHIVPACFMAPLKPTFDLCDAQTIMALDESSMCLKTVCRRCGDEFLTYLHGEYLPTLQISPELIEEYCQAIKADNSVFKSYVKAFFMRTRT